jgi:hypothetical protein
MVHPTTPYIDGNRTLMYKTIDGAGTVGNPHTNVTRPHEDFTYIEGGYKAYNVEPTRYQSTVFVFNIVAGTNFLDNPATGQCFKRKIMHVSITSTNYSLTDFVIATTGNRDALWVDTAVTDAHYTSQSGVFTNNQMALVRSSSSNPRTLQPNSTVQMILNVEAFGEIYFRVVSTGVGNMIFRCYSTLL